MRILVAEQNPVTRRLMIDTLVEWGHDVTPCADTRRLIEILGNGEPPQIALIDIGLGDSHGGLFRWNHNNDQPAKAPYTIVMVTRERQDEVLGALDAGADDYLSKPVTLADLRSRILAATRIVSLDGVDTTRVEHVPSGELERKIAELEESRARIVRVQESVRDEIAADLHDHVQTQLSLLYFRLLDIKYMVEPADAKAAYEIDQLAEELDLLRENAIRKLSQRLYPSKVRIGLIPGLRDLQDRHDGQLPIDLTVTPEVYAMEPAGESRIPFNTRLALYRIADEAVTNAVRHSHAARASIRLDSREQSLIISIEDNGSGFDTAATGKGLGIATMRDYVETLRGSFQLQSAPGSGTKITASVPLQQ